MKNSDRKPWHLNGRQVAEWLGVSTKTVSQRDYPRCGKFGHEVIYDIREIMKLDAVKGLVFSGDGEQIDHDAEKARLTKAQAGLAELKLEEELKRLRPVEEIDEAVDAALTPVAAGLDSLPLTIRRECPELSDRAIELAQRVIATMRNNLADDHINRPSEVGEG